MRENWKGTLIIKGIQNIGDAKRAAEFGADAIILSNHGRRQLDRAPVPLHLLAGVERTFEILQSQMIRNMKLLGVNTLEELEPRHVRLLRR